MLRVPFDGTYRLTSYFDHTTPDFTPDSDVTIYTGESVASCSPYCYHGHNGIDWAMCKPFKLSDRRSIFREAKFPDCEVRSATVAVLEDLIGAYEEGRPTLGNAEVTHRATELCLAVAESHIQGRRVELPLSNRDLYIWHV